MAGSVSEHLTELTWPLKRCLAPYITHTCRYEIVGELTEYTRDINPSMAREAVRAVGCIALAVGGGVDGQVGFSDPAPRPTLFRPSTPAPAPPSTLSHTSGAGCERHN